MTQVTQEPEAAREKPLGPPRPRIAGVLSLWPALGLFYVGRTRAAWLIGLCAPVAMVALMFIGVLAPGAFPAVIAVVVAMWLGTWIGSGVWAVSIARRSARTGPGPRVPHAAGFALGTWVWGVLVASLFRVFVAEPFVTPGASMLPTLEPGDRFFVLKMGPKAHWGHGDVLVVNRKPEGGAAGPVVAHVQRVMAIADDRFAVRGTQLFVELQELTHKPCPTPDFSYSAVVEGKGMVFEASCFEETTLEGHTYQVLYDKKPSELAPRGNASTRLSPDEIFLMGDNRDHANDSRYQGTVGHADVVGRAAVIWFSWTPKTGIRWDRIGRTL